MPVSLLAAKFAAVGFPTWVLVNALWTELAVFAERLPEGYDIGAYLMLALTLSNIAPAAMHMIIRTQDIHAKKRNIWVVNATGIVTTILLAGCWSFTTPIGSNSYSVPLYLLTVAAGAACNSTTVTHFSYVGHFERHCTSLLSFGAGMGSFFVGVLAIIQYTMVAPHQFSVSLFFFICLAPWVVTCVVLPKISADEASTKSSVSKHLLTNQEEEEEEGTGGESDANGEHGKASHAETRGEYGMIETTNVAAGQSLDPVLGSQRLRSISVNVKPLGLCGCMALSEQRSGGPLLSEQDFLLAFQGFLLVHFIVCSLGYGMIPAVISVVCGKFSSDADNLLIWSTVLVCFCDPIARGLTYKYSTERFGMLSLLWASTALLVLLPLAMPSSSSFFDSAGAGGVIVVAYVVFMSSFNYAVTCHFLYIHSEMQRLETSAAFNSIAYSWLGFITQCGSVAGTMVAFLIVVLAT